ncbi:hypothetical protein DEA98_21515 [Brucella pseudogrignonensis]|nr:hypothetical protein [Brucella pseudogrignonensis]NKX16805.1 FCD domain-containing protein [Brucella pseudogrignonensis]
MEPGSEQKLSAGLAEHENIYGLIAAGKASDAREAMREHITNSTAYLEQAIRQSRNRPETG